MDQFGFAPQNPRTLHSDSEVISSWHFFFLLEQSCLWSRRFPLQKCFNDSVGSLPSFYFQFDISLVVKEERERSGILKVGLSKFQTKNTKLYPCKNIALGWFTSCCCCWCAQTQVELVKTNCLRMVFCKVTGFHRMDDSKASKVITWKQCS